LPFILPCSAGWPFHLDAVALSASMKTRPVIRFGQQISNSSNYAANKSFCRAALSLVNLISIRCAILRPFLKISSTVVKGRNGMAFDLDDADV